MGTLKIRKALGNIRKSDWIENYKERKNDVFDPKNFYSSNLVLLPKELKYAIVLFSVFYLSVKRIRPIRKKIMIICFIPTY